MLYLKRSDIEYVLSSMFDSNEQRLTIGILPTLDVAIIGLVFIENEKESIEEMVSRYREITARAYDRTSENWGAAFIESNPFAPTFKDSFWTDVAAFASKDPYTSNMIISRKPTKRGVIEELSGDIQKLMDDGSKEESSYYTNYCIFFHYYHKEYKTHVQSFDYCLGTRLVEVMS